MACYERNMIYWKSDVPSTLNESAIRFFSASFILIENKKININTKFNSIDCHKRMNTKQIGMVIAEYTANISNEM